MADAPACAASTPVAMAPPRPHKSPPPVGPTAAGELGPKEAAAALGGRRGLAAAERGERESLRGHGRGQVRSGRRAPLRPGLGGHSRCSSLPKSQRQLGCPVPEEVTAVALRAPLPQVRRDTSCPSAGAPAAPSQASPALSAPRPLPHPVGPPCPALPCAPTGPPSRARVSDSVGWH